MEVLPGGRSSTAASRGDKFGRNFLNYQDENLEIDDEHYDNRDFVPVMEAVMLAEAFFCTNDTNLEILPQDF